jgi:hypothetical protein
MVQRVTAKSVGIMAASVSAMLSLVMPMYVYWFNPDQYLGQFSINPMFNPTHMAVKAFGLFTFIVAVDLILRYKGKEGIFFNGIKSTKWLYIIFGTTLFLSTFTKPTFMFMLIPAGVVYLLIDLIIALWKKDGSWKHVWNFMWKIACASIPSLVYLLISYASFYFWGGTNSDAKVAIYPFLTAWKIYSPNVLKSWILAMSFPCWMVLTNLKYFIKTVEGRLALIGYAIGTLEFCFIVEEGSKLTHLNFCWPMQSGMLLIWGIAGANLVRLTCVEEHTKWNTVVITVGWLLLSIHLFSGLYYISPFMYII